VQIFPWPPLKKAMQSETGPHLCFPLMLKSEIAMTIYKHFFAAGEI
jgi:hypothetical protein